MGYSTKFAGELLFTRPLTHYQVADLENFLGEDCRGHSWEEFLGMKPSLTYIDLKFNNEQTGLRWDGSEKTYDLVEKVNLIILWMKTKYGSDSFGLTGSMNAIGESNDDVWILMIGEDGFAHKISCKINPFKLTCPHCNKEIDIGYAEPNQGVVTEIGIKV